mgnify:CR=1 FL=1
MLLLLWTGTAAGLKTEDSRVLPGTKKVFRLQSGLSQLPSDMNDNTPTVDLLGRRASASAKGLIVNDGTVKFVK